MTSPIQPVPPGRPSFLDMPRLERLDQLEADVAILAVPYGVPYDMEGSRFPSAPAPWAIREQSLWFRRYLSHYDVDFGGDLFAGREVRIVDCGEVAMRPGQYLENMRRTTEVVRAILQRGAIPIILGGDHAVPIPVLRAYEDFGPIFVVQIDAHLDWRDEVNGVREGLSSPMRRASEMPWVSGMAQIGLRGVGSGRQQEFDDARAYGSILVTAREVHEQGAGAVLERVPVAGRYYVTFDADGLDPAIAPGVNAPSPGGLTYYQAFDLLRGLAERGRIVGFDFVELAPARDPVGITSLHAARLILNLIGALAHTRQVGRARAG
jgi:agmatinase